jgi:hypothetical protein
VGKKRKRKPKKKCCGKFRKKNGRHCKRCPILFNLKKREKAAKKKKKKSKKK